MAEVSILTKLSQETQKLIKSLVIQVIDSECGHQLATFMAQEKTRKIRKKTRSRDTKPSASSAANCNKQ